MTVIWWLIGLVMGTVIGFLVGRLHGALERDPLLSEAEAREQCLEALRTPYDPLLPTVYDPIPSMRENQPRKGRVCFHCGHEEHSDLNAARNMLQRAS